MTYVDVFVLPVKKKDMPAYLKMAKMGSKIWKKYGALEYYECEGDDLEPKWVKATFPKVAKAKPDETVVFSFIIYRSRAHRDKVNSQVMKDSMMNDSKWKDKPMPFDMQRISFGGFKTIVKA